MRRVASLAVTAAVGEARKKVPARPPTFRRRRVRGEVATLVLFNVPSLAERRRVVSLQPRGRR